MNNLKIAALMVLAGALLPAKAQTANICDRTPEVRDEILYKVSSSDCAAVNLASVTETLDLSESGLTSLKAGDFDGLDSLGFLKLSNNQLKTLPVGLFDELGSLWRLDLDNNQLTMLPAGVFDELANLDSLLLSHNQLTTLPKGLFDGLDNLEYLGLQENRLTALPKGLFDGLDILDNLDLDNNQLTTLPAGVFDELANLESLLLSYNQLKTLPAGLFDGLSSLESLYLNNNHLVGLTEDDSVFDGLTATIYLSGQTTPLTTDGDGEEETEAGETETEGGTEDEPTRLVAAVPLMLSASHSMQQGFARIVNRSNETGVVRVTAFDDGGYSPDPFDIELGANQAFQFNADDLEYGNSNKGIEGVGSPVQGDWRLDVETTLSVRVLAFVRASDGFLTAMHDVLPELPRDEDRRRVAMTFNPGSNTEQVSKLRLVNTGDRDERVMVAGVDDEGDNPGLVTLTLAAGQSRTLSAQELENGAHGLRGALGDGVGKWRLFVTAGDAVVAMSLLDAASGHLSNISTMGVALQD